MNRFTSYVYTLILCLFFLGDSHAHAQSPVLADINTTVYSQDCQAGSVCANIYNNETSRQQLDVSLIVLEEGKVIYNKLHQTLTIDALTHSSVSLEIDNSYTYSAGELYVVVTNTQGLPLSRVKAGPVSQFVATTSVVELPQVNCVLADSTLDCGEVNESNTPTLSIYEGSVTKIPVWQTLLDVPYDLNQANLNPGPHTLVVSVEDTQVFNTTYVQKGERLFTMLSLDLDRDSYEAASQPHISAMYSGGNPDTLLVSYQIQSNDRVCVEDSGVALSDKIVTTALASDCSQAQLYFSVVDQEGKEVFSQGNVITPSLTNVIQSKGEKSIMLYGLILLATLVIVAGVIVAAVRVRGIQSFLVAVLLGGVSMGIYHSEVLAAAFVSEDKPQYSFTVDTNKQQYALDEDAQFSFSVTDLDTLQTPSPLSVYMRVNDGANRQLLDRDTRRSFMYSFDIPSNELYEGRNKVTFTIPGFCGSYYNHSSFDGALFGTWDCEFSIDIQVGQVCTDPTDPTCSCIDEGWFDDPSEVCVGVDFTQTSNCLRTRDATGTKTDGECAVCINSSWDPSTDNVCAGVDFVQTSNCGLTRFAQGTKYGDGCAPLVPPTANDFECSLNTIDWERCDGNTYTLRTPRQGIYVRPVSGSAQSWNISQAAGELTGQVIDTVIANEHIMQFAYISPQKLYQNIVVTMTGAAGPVQQIINIKLLDINIIEE